MAKTKPGYRVVIQLDPRVALEAILLNRLERLPLSRRQEWLRGLLVQGFRAECQALRGAPDEAKSRPIRAFTKGRPGGVQKPVSHPAPGRSVVKVKPAHAATASKPFAALGKVIG
jgi:hypothetical protein